MAKSKEETKTEKVETDKGSTASKETKGPNKFEKLGWKKSKSFYIIEKNNHYFMLTDKDPMSIEKIITRTGQSEVLYSGKSMSEKDMEKFMQKNAIG